MGKQKITFEAEEPLELGKYMESGGVHTSTLHSTQIINTFI